LDANVLVSAVAFGGVPAKLVDRLWDRDYLCVTSPHILDETRRTLSKKLAIERGRLEQFLLDLAEVSTVVVPRGDLAASGHGPDDLVLETALLGGCDILVTGDKRHLLPLNPFRGLIIEAPSAFLKRLG
jgi:putative PIN family toxin of toxin-antitoxin system